MTRLRALLTAMAVILGTVATAGCTPAEQSFLEQTLATPAPASATPPVWVSSRPEVERWHQTALDAGWAETEWRWLACVIWRESRGDPSVFNGRGRDQSYGLLQLNMRAHAGWVGPLVDGDFSRLHDPAINLSIGRALYEQAGRSPWRTRRKTC